MQWCCFDKLHSPCVLCRSHYSRACQDVPEGGYTRAQSAKTIPERVMLSVGGPGVWSSMPKHPTWFYPLQSWALQEVRYVPHHTHVACGLLQSHTGLPLCYQKQHEVLTSRQTDYITLQDMSVTRLSPVQLFFFTAISGLSLGPCSYIA